ncbi:RidA family protein [uncultured Cyclobacterium sp.]|uniref:RidA family protein n=1 Tax=uncultured Cyclobacterium sp. TaxID=453820 RepID=UPI0030ED1DEE|tara:strand:- start:17277 stop:18581 length:1305 start_codon:yes stop_codon:yes gene_type:complete
MSISSKVLKSRLGFSFGLNVAGKKLLFVQLPIVLFLLVFGSVMELKGQVQDNATGITYIDPSEKTGSSQATVVGDVSLAFTDQIFPMDKSGKVVGGNDLKKQVIQVFKNLEMTLKSGGTDFSKLLRLNVYLQMEGHSPLVKELIKELLPEGAFPAITLIVAEQPRENVLLTLDAIALGPLSSQGKRGINHYLEDGLYGKSNRSGLAVLPAGRKVFIAGQAEPGKDLLEASDKTMQNLLATLAYIGASASDVVQVKAFINPIADAAAVEEVIAAFFRGKQVPPIVMVEWLVEENKAEIELVASAPENQKDTAAVSYYAPPWMTQATTYSRIVDIKEGGLLFTSGLYAEKGKNEEEKARNLFLKLSEILRKAGSGYDHLVKASYYPSHEKGREGLMKVRTVFYNPERPPVASLIRIQGTGREGIYLNVDMVGVVPD